MQRVVLLCTVLCVALPSTVLRAAIPPLTAIPRTHVSLGITTAELTIIQPSSSGALGSTASAAAVECASALLDDPASTSVGENGAAPGAFVSSLDDPEAFGPDEAAYLCAPEASPLDDPDAFGPDEAAYFCALEVSMDDAPNVAPTVSMAPTAGDVVQDRLLIENSTYHLPWRVSNLTKLNRAKWMEHNGCEPDVNLG